VWAVAASKDESWWHQVLWRHSQKVLIHFRGQKSWAIIEKAHLGNTGFGAAFKEQPRYPRLNCKTILSHAKRQGAQIQRATAESQIQSLLNCAYHSCQNAASFEELPKIGRGTQGTARALATRTHSTAQQGVRGQLKEGAIHIKRSRKNQSSRTHALGQETRPPTNGGINTPKSLPIRKPQWKLMLGAFKTAQNQRT